MALNRQSYVARCCCDPWRSPTTFSCWCSSSTSRSLRCSRTPVSIATASTRLRGCSADWWCIRCPSSHRRPPSGSTFSSQPAGVWRSAGRRSPPSTARWELPTSVIPTSHWCGPSSDSVSMTIDVGTNGATMIVSWEFLLDAKYTWLYLVECSPLRAV